MRILVVGCGSIGKRHIGNLLAADIKNIVACDINSERLNEVKSKYPEVHLGTDLNKALSNNLDGAIVCPPTYLHIPISKKVLEAGVHLMLEKPLSHTLEGVDDLIGTAARNKLVFTVAYTLRFHPGIRKMKELIDNNAIGRIYSVRAECGQYLPDWHPWEDYREFYMSKEALGGGATLDISHEIDYLRWFFGDVKELAAMMGTVSDLEIDTDDLSETILHFRNGVIANLHLDLLQRSYRRNCEIIGKNGTILWDYSKNSIRIYTAESEKWDEIAYEFDRNAIFVEEINHFIGCIKGETAPVVDARDAKETLKIVLAAKESSRKRNFVEIR